MLTPGDVVILDLGTPMGSEAGLRRPAVIVTAARILNGSPNLIQVVPLTRTMRRSSTEIVVEPDHANGVSAQSSAQCQHVRAIASRRIQQHLGNVGPVVLREMRETIALLLDL